MGVKVVDHIGEPWYYLSIISDFFQGSAAIDLDDNARRSSVAFTRHVARRVIYK